MGTFEPQDTMVLVGLTASIILLIAIAVMAVARRSRDSAAPRTGTVRTPEFGSLKRSDIPAPAPPAAPPPVAPPTRLAVPQAPPSAPQPSYTAVALAQTQGCFAGGRADPPARTVIDYSEALIDIGPDASYTAAAIAALLGQPATTNTPPGTPSSSTSYAAVAAATATPPKPRSVSSPPLRIDYSGEASTIPPNASYTAIAVAAALQQH